MGLAVCAVAALLVGGCGARPATTVRFSVDAAALNSHEGTTLQAPDGTLYHYGTRYAPTDFRDSTYGGVEILRGRTAALTGGFVDAGPAFSAATMAELGPLCSRVAGSGGCYHPSVARVGPTYVLWLDVGGTPTSAVGRLGPVTVGGGVSGYAVFTAASPTGPFVPVNFVGRAQLDHTYAAAFYGDESNIYLYRSTRYLVYTELAPSGARQLRLTALNASATAPVGAQAYVQSDGEGPGLFALPDGHVVVTYSHNFEASAIGGCYFCDTASTEVVVSTGTPASGGTGALDHAWSTPASIGGPSCVGQPAQIDILDGAAYQAVDEWVQNGVSGSPQRSHQDVAGHQEYLVQQTGPGSFATLC